MMNRMILKDMYWMEGAGRAYTAEEIEDMGENIKDYVDLYGADDTELLAYCEDAESWSDDCVVEILDHMAEKYGVEVGEDDSAEDVLAKIKEAKTQKEQSLTPQARYDARMTKQISLKFNKGTDADILEKLEKVENIQGYIKQLIRDDLTKAGE